MSQTQTEAYVRPHRLGWAVEIQSPDHGKLTYISTDPDQKMLMDYCRPLGRILRMGRCSVLL